MDWMGLSYTLSHSSTGLPGPSCLVCKTRFETLGLRPTYSYGSFLALQIENWTPELAGPGNPALERLTYKNALDLDGPWVIMASWSLPLLH